MHSESMRLAKLDTHNSLQTRLRQQLQQRKPLLPTLYSCGQSTYTMMQGRLGGFHAVHHAQVDMAIHVSHGACKVSHN